MNWSEKELKSLEKEAKGIRFRCQRTCGIDCCTPSLPGQGAAAQNKCSFIHFG